MYYIHWTSPALRREYNPADFGAPRTVLVGRWQILTHTFFKYRVLGIDRWMDGLILYWYGHRSRRLNYVYTYKRQKLLNYKKRINYNRFKKFKSYNYKGYLHIEKKDKMRTKFYLKKKNWWLLEWVYPKALGINKTTLGPTSFKLDTKSPGMPEGVWPCILSKIAKQCGLRFI